VLCLFHFRFIRVLFFFFLSLSLLSHQVRKQGLFTADGAGVAVKFHVTVMNSRFRAPAAAAPGDVTAAVAAALGSSRPPGVAV
jgi:hypothetical protein